MGSRTEAVNRAFIMSRLLDERYYDKAAEALQMGKSGMEQFLKVCEEAHIPGDMAVGMWKTLMFIESDRTIAAPVDW